MMLLLGVQYLAELCIYEGEHLSNSSGGGGCAWRHYCHNLCVCTCSSVEECCKELKIGEVSVLSWLFKIDVVRGTDGFLCLWCLVIMLLGDEMTDMSREGLNCRVNHWQHLLRWERVLTVGWRYWSCSSVCPFCRAGYIRLHQLNARRPFYLSTGVCCFDTYLTHCHLSLALRICQPGRAKLIATLSYSSSCGNFSSYVYWLVVFTHQYYMSV